MNRYFHVIWVAAAIAALTVSPLRVRAGETYPSLHEADQLMNAGRYSEAIVIYDKVRKDAIAQSDRRTSYIASGNIGLANAALGDFLSARENLSNSAEEARNEFPDISAINAFNASLIEARYQDIMPSNLLWLPRFRGESINPAKIERENAILSFAQAAMRDTETNTTSPIYSRSRILFVNYAYTSTDDIRLLRYLKQAQVAAISAGDADVLLAVADAAIGRASLKTEAESSGNFTTLAYDVLQAAQALERSSDVDIRGTGLLGRLYGLAGRVPEALALTGEASLKAKASSNVALQLEFETQYAALLELKGNKGQARDAYERLDGLISNLQPALASRLSFEERSTLRNLMSMAVLAEVTLIFEDASDNSQQLYRARSLLELNKVLDFEAFFASPCLQQWSQQRKSLDSLIDGKTAVIYPVVMDDHTDVLVATQGSITRYSALENLDRSAVLRQADILRESLRSPVGRAFDEPAQRLYDLLLRPAAADLRKAGINTLVFAPNKELRGVPLSVLKEGDNFVVQSFSVATALAVGLVDTTPMDRRHAKALIAGTSTSLTSPRIANVDKELRDVAAIMGTEPLVDSDFTREAMLNAAPEINPSVIHIASHGQFGHTPAESFVLAYDRPMKFGDIKAIVQSAGDRGVDLLTLSACETAKGDDDAILGLAGIAYQAGARSVMATLWTQDDAVGAAVMKRFYEGVFKIGLSKAEALRQAQIERLEDPGTRHPYYWAAYVVVGNWQ